MPLNAKDRVFVVTGANSGIGKATALGLARPGGTVVMACRNADRSEAARQDIVRQSGNAHVAVMIVDLASEASTRAFAKEFQRRYPRLDALVNNAGAYMSRLEGTGVTVNACHPGVIRTNLAMGGSSVVVRFGKLFLRGPAKGAQTPIYLATSPEVEGISGKYFVRNQVLAPSARAQDPAVARRLFEVSMELAHLSA